MANVKVKIGIFGGTGVDNPNIMTDRQEKFVDTPFGKPSDALITGNIQGVECVLIARHGRKHTVMPTDINYRANVWALKEEGCTHIVVTTACGSLTEAYRPGEIVFPDQIIDRTTKRPSTFYDGQTNSPVGVCHIPMHDPYCSVTKQILANEAQKLGIPHHASGVNVVIEGPRFSTRAESRMFRAWGGEIISMTAMPEVALANEAGLCYAAIAMVTDYDCWRDDHAPVTVESVIATFKVNVANAIKILIAAIPEIAAKDWTEIINERKNTAKSAVMMPAN
ncbi:S-methyl-5'-thioadenosine phosphorylase isoform X1 [Nematostella vectensis]|uniref:S-methyl-5'-thioadenosine phosphorylase isoform X1 n=1 Tax=Nematostella vectensis TaxID=45351 RepID=UPI0020770A1B|nr:S-methyl-5'-thioadenosine phosphorylase isoform X1 [Nematostella vectensis]